MIYTHSVYSFHLTLISAEKQWILEQEKPFVLLPHSNILNFKDNFKDNEGASPMNGSNWGIFNYFCTVFKFSSLFFIKFTAI